MSLDSATKQKCSDFHGIYHSDSQDLENNRDIQRFDSWLFLIYDFAGKEFQVHLVLFHVFENCNISAQQRCGRLGPHDQISLYDAIVALEEICIDFEKI